MIDAANNPHVCSSSLNAIRHQQQRNVLVFRCCSSSFFFFFLLFSFVLLRSGTLLAENFVTCV